MPMRLRSVPPIEQAEVRQRQERARAATEAAGYDALLVVGRSFYDRPGDLAYLTNHFPPFPTTVFSDTLRGMGHGVLLLPVNGAPTLLTDPRGHRADLVAVDDCRANADLGAAIIALLRERSLDRANIGLVGEDIFPAALDRQIARELPALRLDPENTIVTVLRRIKSDAELALLRRAAMCAHVALTAAVNRIYGGNLTERVACAAATEAALAVGADFVRYFRVHSGPWSAAGSRWPQAMDRNIEDGEIVVLDAIGAYQGYQFDVNRTTAHGRLDDDHRALAETVAAATAAAVDAARAGNRVADIAAAATAVVAPTRFAAHLGTMMGHGIGLETVELPYVTATDQTILEPGMTLCIEPGIFIPGWAGAAIEQEVIITADGPPEIITPTPVVLW